MASKTKAAIILSTGMAIKKDIDRAIKTLKKNNCSEFYLLKCTSLYPANDILLNLRAMNEMGKQYKIPCGYSDHTTDELASIAAVSMGAKIIEKHFTMDKKFSNFRDHSLSADFHDFKKIKDNVHRLKHKISILGLENGYRNANAYEHNLRVNSKDKSEIFEKTLTTISEYLKII